MTVPPPLVVPALLGFGAGLLTLSFPTSLLLLLTVAALAATLRLPRVGAFAAGAGATSAAYISVLWVRCQLSSPDQPCSDAKVFALVAALSAVIGVLAAMLWRSHLRA